MVSENGCMVRIQGVATQLYLVMGVNGTLFAQVCIVFSFLSVSVLRLCCCIKTLPPNWWFSSLSQPVFCATFWSCKKWTTWLVRRGGGDFEKKILQTFLCQTVTTEDNKTRKQFSSAQKGFKKFVSVPSHPPSPSKVKLSTPKQKLVDV